MTVDLLLLYGLAGLLALVWGIVEIVQTFEAMPWRALCTWGSLLLLAANIALSCFALALVLGATPLTSHTWLTALAVGAGWQALLRSQLNFIQPLPLKGQEAEGIALSLAGLYGRFQGFCRRQIDRSLAGERLALLNSALSVEEESLKRQALLLASAMVTVGLSEVEDYLRRIEEREMPQEHKKILLASFVLDMGGMPMFRNFLREARRRREGENKG